MRQEDVKKIRSKFKRVWPWKYGGGAPNSRDPASARHREAFDYLIGAIWPAGTATKFLGLEGFPTRPPFHSERLKVCVRWLADIWSEVVPRHKFPESKVREFFIGRVGITPKHTCIELFIFSQMIHFLYI